MPNLFGGKNYKKNKSGNVRRKSKNPDRPVDTTTGIDHYGIVQRRIGGNRLLVKIDNGNEVQAVIPGRFMKKVWFNAGDYIQVRSEDGGYYDIIQKIMNHGEQQNAQIALNKRETGEQNIFRPDVIVEEEDDDDYVNNKNSSEDDDIDEFGNKNVKVYKKDEITANKPNININKLIRKKKEKERDIDRRSNTTELYDKPTSVIEKSNLSVSSTDSDNSSTDSKSGKNIKGVKDIKNSKDTKSIESTDSTDSTDSSGSDQD